MCCVYCKSKVDLGFVFIISFRASTIRASSPVEPGTVAEAFTEEVFTTAPVICLSVSFARNPAGTKPKKAVVNLKAEFEVEFSPSNRAGRTGGEGDGHRCVCVTKMTIMSNGPYD